MRRLFIVATLFATCSAMADDMVYKSETTSIRLTEAPCARASFQAVLAQIKPDPSKAAVVTFNGRHIDGCWITHAESASVILIDEDGDAGFIPMAEFKREPGV